jgi:hypothetical protein
MRKEEGIHDLASLLGGAVRGGIREEGMDGLYYDGTNLTAHVQGRRSS